MYCPSFKNVPLLAVTISFVKELWCWAWKMCDRFVWLGRSICRAGTINLLGWDDQFAGLGWSICRAPTINFPGSYNQFSGLLRSICWARTKSHNGLGKESANYLGLDENNVAWRVSPSWSKPGGPQNRHRVDWPAREGWLCTLKLVLQFSTT